MKGQEDSAARALASRVLPHPGGPVRIAPLGSLAPYFWNVALEDNIKTLKTYREFCGVFQIIYKLADLYFCFM